MNSDTLKIVIAQLRDQYRLDEPVYVARPTLPDRAEYEKLLAQIWDSRWLTNRGRFHEDFEARLAEHLEVPYVSLFGNGTLALLFALKALGIAGGEVVTTPFTFAATAHALNWNGVEPVFCDIDSQTFNLTADTVRGAVSDRTTGIMPVHVFGTPCDARGIGEVSTAAGVPVIYDAAHAFGVRENGRSILLEGDLSALSFHATKPFTTAEGGALVMKSPELKQHVDFLRNFGIADEETVVGPGINGKMSELHAALGLLQIPLVEKERARRAELAHRYAANLQDLPGLQRSEARSATTPFHAYLPILVDEDQFGWNRDQVFEVLRALNMIARKYFYPLCSNYPCYADLPSARPEDLPVANRVADQILCLPLYADLEPSTVDRVSEALHALHAAA